MGVARVGAEGGTIMKGTEGVRELRESTMSLPVMTWLDGLGYTPYAEVPNYDTCIDIVAMKEPGVELIAIEMKTSLTQRVRQQAYVAQLIAERSYCAVISKPKPSSLTKCSELGIGVLRVYDGSVEVLVEPSEKKAVSPFAKRVVVEQLRRRIPGGVAGRPNLKGEGPAQECAQRVLRYRQKNPDARWIDVFNNIENHYSSMESMRGALTSRRLV